jgi:hypothetical protein
MKVSERGMEVCGNAGTARHAHQCKAAHWLTHRDSPSQDGGRFNYNINGQMGRPNVSLEVSLKKKK